MELEVAKVPIERILLHPNNPRFFDLDEVDEVSEERYWQDGVQDHTVQKLLSARHFEIRELKESIRTNGFLPLDKILVKPYAHRDGYYLVVEGNRRVLAVKALVNDYLQGVVDLPEDVVASLQELEVLVLPSTGDRSEDEHAEMVLQGIRHVSGPKEWGAYQRARFVVQLHDSRGQDFQSIRALLGIGPRVTVRMYRAFKALRAMFDDEAYGELARPQLFSHFDEAVKSPAIRDWLGWNEAVCEFTNKANLELFYSWLLPHPGEDDEEEAPRLETHFDVRKLGKFITNDTARSRFASGVADVEQAHLIANPPPPSPWQETARECLETLNNLKVTDLTGWTEADEALLDQILDKIGELQGLAQRLNQ